jgi:hypothetical protein
MAEGPALDQRSLPARSQQGETTRASESDGSELRAVYFGGTTMKAGCVFAGVIGVAAVLTPQVSVAQPTGPAATHVVLLEGELSLCAGGGQLYKDGECAVVTGACTAMTVTEAGDIIEHTSEQDKSELIRRHFDHISSQDDLLSEFQAPTGACPVFAQINPGIFVAPAVGLTILTIRGITKDDDPISP